MRNMSVVRIGSGSALIRGERRDEDEKDRDGQDSGWRAFEYCVSLSTPVIYLDPNDKKVEEPKKVEVPKVEKRKEQKDMTETTQTNVEATVDKSATATKPKGTPGRPSKGLAIQLPDPDTEFTIGDLAAKNGVEKYDVLNFFKKREKDGTPVKLVEVGLRKTGSKGKPSKVYKLG